MQYLLKYAIIPYQCIEKTNPALRWYCFFLKSESICTKLMSNCFENMPLALDKKKRFLLFAICLFVCLFVCCCFFVALHPKSTTMVMVGRSVHLSTLFSGQARTSFVHILSLVTDSNPSDSHLLPGTLPTAFVCNGYQISISGASMDYSFEFEKSHLVGKFDTLITGQTDACHS